MKKYIVLLLSLATTAVIYGQLQPGFQKQEYIDLMMLSAQFGGEEYAKEFKPDAKYRMVYRSPEIGLDNRWDLWMEGRETAVLSIRGTTEKGESWLANLYAAMVPAKGEIQLSTNEKFQYNLASDPKAAVHVGWLVSTGYLSNDILPKLDSLYQTGTRNVVILGHSQGGAIAYLLTAHFYALQRSGRIPADIRFKTYCSAAPKPGNLYFAYEYEHITQNGWAYNVVNSADWVPEVPVSIQTMGDFNTTNPFKNAPKMIKQLPFPQNLVVKSIYNSLKKPLDKAQRRYQKYLGKFASKGVAKNLEGYVAPQYFESNNYVRTGNTIVLFADEAYYKIYPDNPDKLFSHHFHGQYVFLASKLPDWGQETALAFKPEQVSANTLNGSWQLNYITGIRIAFEGLYPDQKPEITFNVSEGTVSGSTSCNFFNGKFKADGNKLSFDQAMAMTKKMCEGEGEQRFLEAFNKVDGFKIPSPGKLILTTGDLDVMRFTQP